MRKRSSRLFAAVLAIIFAFSVSPIGCNVDRSYAGVGEDGAGLDVYYNGTKLATFTSEELYGIAWQEGSNAYNSYNYSALNANPTFKGKEEGCRNAIGPTVEGILEEAGIDVDSLDSSALIKICGGEISNNKVSFAFTKEELLGERYYYPNANESTVDVRTGRIDAKAYENKKSVPAIINMTQEDGTLMFGQKTPNEENYSAFCHYMYATSDDEGNGEIRVEGPTGASWNPITETSAGDSKLLPQGTKIYFTTLGTNEVEPSKGYPKFWIYYTVDGTEPSQASNMYNYNKYYLEGGHDISKGVNAPVIKAGENRIRVKVRGYGKGESSESTFTYYGLPAAPGISAATEGMNANRVSWNAVEGAEGYEVYRNSQKIADITDSNAGSFVDAGLPAWSAYTYNVRAYISVDGEKAYGEYSTAAVAQTGVKAPTIYSAVAGKKKATIRWDRIADANGYEVYRATSPNGKYKKVKKLKKASKTSLTNKRLKKKKAYYFKVRAFKKVTKKKVRYGSFSTVVRVDTY